MLFRTVVLFTKRRSPPPLRVFVAHQVPKLSKWTTQTVETLKVWVVTSGVSCWFLRKGQAGWLFVKHAKEKQSDEKNSMPDVYCVSVRQLRGLWHTSAIWWSCSLLRSTKLRPVARGFRCEMNCVIGAAHTGSTPRCEAAGRSAPSEGCGSTCSPVRGTQTPRAKTRLAARGSNMIQRSKPGVPKPSAWRPKSGDTSSGLAILVWFRE